MKIDDLVPDFELADLDGRLRRLYDHRAKIVVVNFWSCECPHSARTDSLITTWHAGWGDQVAVLFIATNSNETPGAMMAAGRLRRLPPILMDPQHLAADLFEAQTTPHIFVLDREGRLRYRGAVDDVSFGQRVPLRFFLAEAVQALLAGERPPVTDTQPYGCAIIRYPLE